MRLRNRLYKEYVAGVKSFMDTVKGSSYDKWIFHIEEDEFVDTGGFNVRGLHMNHENETNIDDEGDDEMYGLMHEMLGSTSNDRLIYRALHHYKTYVKNKARPEGSIAEAYIVNESLTFCSMYLHSIETQFNRIHQNNDGGLRTQGLSIFSQQAQPFGGVHRSKLSQLEIECAHWGLWDIQQKDVLEVQDEHVFYQQNESCDTVLKVQCDNLESQLFHRDDVNADVIQDPSLHEEMMVTTQNTNDFICDEEEEDETIEDYSSDETNELQYEDDSDLDHNIS
ncbi:hypothetical protein JRO89_XS02G0278700 [Xanthoceras sorbifolium]|uniref:DUF4218 domain-containing protein n=1 Tax=Xanthoceras sorbifolium TaxID=99658 RepID=A0ABQ8IH62_9ROSI|nr:hypothetical protein JRO89_XS02G0278700 [Xanthoceras sorbifolium]